MFNIHCLFFTTNQKQFCFTLYRDGIGRASYRGHLILLTNYEEERIRVGEIVLFKLENREVPILHRVMQVHEK